MVRRGAVEGDLLGAGGLHGDLAADARSTGPAMPDSP